jgi:hypothetical protein
MGPFRSLVALLAVLSLGGRSLPAQQTASDSAQVLLQAARLLQAQGQGRLARELLGRVVVLFPGTAAADTARILVSRTPEPESTGFARTSFIVYHTLYGGFLGLAIPAAFGAEEPEPYGAGLILGAPAGFFLSRAYAGSRPLTDGQAGVINFGSFWGTWQGFGWSEVFNLGDEEVCEVDFCYTEESGTAGWAAAVVGGLTGLGVGLLAAKAPVAPGTSTLIFSSSLWGTWYGFALGTLFDAEDDDLLAATLAGGNIGLLAAIPAAHAWKPTRSQVRLASAGGLMGGIVALGIGILADVDDEKGAVAIISAGVTAGLIGGAVLGRDRSATVADASGEVFDPALVNVGNGHGLRLGVPLPTPTLIRLNTAKGRATTPGLRITLFHARLP